MSESSKVLLLGAEAVGKSFVLARLQELCAPIDSVNHDQKQDVQGPNTTSEELLLSTKYYDAKLQFYEHRVAENTLVQDLACKIEDFEAIIAVVDSTNAENFQQIVRFVEKTIDIHDFEVCLLLANKSINDDSQRDNSAVKEWCQDHGFEYICVIDAHHSSKWAPQMQQDDVERRWSTDVNEKQGMERVLEALECNMWHSMEIKQTLSEAKETSNPTSSQTNQDDQEKNEEGDTAVQAPKQTAARTVQCTNQDEERRLEEALRSLRLADDQVAARRSQRKEECEHDDVDMDEFSALVAEVARIRETGKNLSDQERRQQAENMAIRLWNLLGSDDEGDDSD